MKVRIISGVVGGILAILILILHKTFVFPLHYLNCFVQGSACIAGFLSVPGFCMVLHCRSYSITETLLRQSH